MFKINLFAICLAFSSLANAAVQNVTLKNSKGETVGSATIAQLAKGVKISVEVHGLPPGEHAIHFHEKASCVGPKFDSAGPTPSYEIVGVLARPSS